ncbi:MAG: QueT transporter family protein [Ethanoligenens sp.]
METFSKNKIRAITTGAVIAALYAAITLLFQPISYGVLQFRISEILTVLPFFTPAAIPGLFIGCIFANIASSLGPIAIIVGSGATLLAAWLTYKMPNKWLAPLPPVICNGVIVGIELYFVLHEPLWLTIGSVALGEAVVCFVGGIPLMLGLGKVEHRLFAPSAR